MKQELESTVENHLLKQSKRYNFLCYKFTSPGNNGVPDRLLIGNNTTAFVELKRPKGATRALQNAVIKNMRNHGAIVYRADNKQKIDEILKKLINHDYPSYLNEKKESKPMNTAKKEQLVKRIIAFLEKEEVFYDVIIYYDTIRIFSNTSKRLPIHEKFGLKFEENINVYDYLEYANDETISISFEGPMYLAYNENTSFRKKLDKLFEKQGLYAEQGYSWSLSLYPID